MSPFRAALPLVIAALAASGCGSDSDSGSGPLDNALGYLPEDAPLVITIDTDVEGSQFKAIGKIADRFPFSSQIEKQLKGQLERGSVSFENDVKPLLGNEFVVGATDPTAIVSSGDSDQFIGAIEVKDKDKLEDLVKKEGDEKGEVSGAKVYEDNDGDAFAIEDDVLVVADTRRNLDDALEQRDADDRLTEKTFDETVKGLPKDALIKVGGDLQKLLASDPDTKAARKVAWVDALRTFGAALSFKSDRADIDFQVTTDGGELSDEEVPLASGNESPGVLSLANEVGVGLRNPAHLFHFGESAAQAVEPEKYADYQTAKRTIERQLDIDVDDDLIAQLEGDASITVNTAGGVGARIELEDAAKFRETLGKLEKKLPGILSSSSGSRTRLEREDGATVLRSADGDTVAYKVDGDALLISNLPARVRQLAGEEPKQVDGAKGAVAMTANAQQLFLEALRSRRTQLPGGGLGQALGGQIIAGPLDQLTGSARASKDGISGKLSLTFD